MAWEYKGGRVKGELVNCHGKHLYFSFCFLHTAALWIIIFGSNSVKTQVSLIFLMHCQFIPDRCVPERKFSDVPYLGRCVPWLMRPLVDASLGRCVPWSMRPRTICPIPWARLILGRTYSRGKAWHTLHCPLS
jgi:hypothetical protein